MTEHNYMNNGYVIKKDDGLDEIIQIPYNINNSVNYNTNFCNLENQPEDLTACQAAVDFLKGVTDANSRPTDLIVNNVDVNTDPSGCYKKIETSVDPTDTSTTERVSYNFNSSTSIDVNNINFTDTSYNRICKKWSFDRIFK